MGMTREQTIDRIVLTYPDGGVSEYDRRIVGMVLDAEHRAGLVIMQPCEDCAADGSIGQVFSGSRWKDCMACVGHGFVEVGR